MIKPWPNGSAITSLIAGTNVTISDPSGPEPTINSEGGSGGGPVSLSGAGLTESPGILDQAGGMSITDSESDGFSVSTNGGISLQNSAGFGIELVDSSGNGIVINPYSGGDIQMVGPGLGDTQITLGAKNEVCSPLANALITSYIPLTVTTGVNDTFTYTPIGTGVPEVFTIAPGVYADVPSLQAAIQVATGTSSDTFSDYGYTNENPAGTTLLWTLTTVGDLLSEGPTDILQTIYGSNIDGGARLIVSTDIISFFDSGFSGSQQTITGTLSAVTDPNVKAILTSLLTALASKYGLVINGTD